MKISFITPSPSTLKQEWYRDLHYQKVGVPNLAGWLRRAGYPDIRHYDFNNQVTRAYAARPGPAAAAPGSWRKLLIIF